MKSVKVKLDKYGWPESIPWPTHGEYTTMRLTDGDGRCCLTGWASVAILGFPTPFDEGTSHAMQCVRGRMLDLARARGFSYCEQFNDHCSTTDADREEFWRQTWEHFGYRGPR